jgi:hypothetical protein
MGVNAKIRGDGKSRAKLTADDRMTVWFDADGDRQLCITFTDAGGFAISILAPGDWIDVCNGDIGGLYPQARFNRDLEVG